MGFETLTPIQAKAIPAAIDGKDIIALAETGSGKTAAFLIPALIHILKRPHAEKSKQILVLAPTRELAVQIVDVARLLTQFMPGVSTACLIGGVKMDRQINSLKRKPALVVATPGRLIDHQRRRSIDLRSIDMLILDEADRMFDMGFAPQIKEVLKFVPKQRQTMLFSATFPPEIRELAQSILINPENVVVEGPTKSPAKIQQRIFEVTQEHKNNKTLDLINSASGSVMIFARTKHRTDRLARYLNDFGVKVAKLHGDRSQGQRTQAIQGFKSGTFRVLVATDIAARGIDVDSISDVINYDLPMNSEDYIHRIGRTGRAGREGQASTLVTVEDRSKWSNIARRLGLPVIGGPKKGSGKRPSRNRRRNHRRGSDTARPSF